MFKISIVKPDKIGEVCAYLGVSYHGLLMACVEEGKILGAVGFDIVSGMGMIEHIKAEEEMKSIVIAAALNFLDINGIRIVKTSIANETGFFEKLGFIRQNSGGELALDLEGYFDVKHH